jgi:uncharacterized surface protein with fasciclin (FAS1) repeats
MKFTFALTSLLFGYAASEDPGSATTGTVVDVAISDPDTFSSLVDFVVLADLADTLATAEGITVFAPINDAFAALTEAAPDVVANLLTEQWKAHLQNVLLFHVLADEVPSSAVTDGLSVTTLNGEEITFTVNDDGIFVNSNSQVVAADVDASNGVIHAIGGVLLPSWVSNTILDIAQNTEDLTNLVSLILFANPAIVEILSSPGGYTVFAPSNESFQALFDQFDVNAATLALLDQQEGILTAALKYHVVEGVYDTGDIVDGLEVTTLQGETLTLSLSDTDSGFTVNGLEIVSTDILANNGVVHVIKGVLIPQELSGTDESEVIVPDSVSNATDSESSEEPDAIDTSINSIVDVAVSTDDLSNLVSLVLEADASILEALSSPGNYTVFAPSNAAVQALFDQFGVDAVTLGALDATTGILSKVLTYHVVKGLYDSSDIVDGIELTTLQGEDLTLNLSGDSATGFVVNDIEIIATDILADNGIVHVINGVLVPTELAANEESAEESATIVDIASGAADFSTLVSLILLADESIAGLLSSPGNFTVLAPTNAAFEELLSALDISVDDLVTVEEKAGFLSKLLSYHVVNGSYESSEIVDGLELTTLQGEKVTFTLSDDSPTGVAVNGANVVAADILASSGVIHAIDSVLIAPPISGGPGTSVATSDKQTDLTSVLQAFYGKGLVLILDSLLASISDSN